MGKFVRPPCRSSINVPFLGLIIYILLVLADTDSAYANGKMRMIAMQTCRQILGFKNHWNKSFYDHMSKDDFNARVETMGLDTTLDVQKIMPMLKEKDVKGAVVWELGAAYGRVVDAVLEDTEHLRVEAIEHSNLSINLRMKYADNPRVEVVGYSVLKLDRENYYIDAALWMFSGFYEFPPSQKRKALSIIRRHLSPDGFLVIDVPEFQAFPHGEEDEYLEIPHPTKNKVLRVHLMTTDSLKQMVLEQGFSSIECTTYILPGQPRARVSCVARK